VGVVRILDQFSVQRFEFTVPVPKSVHSFMTSEQGSYETYRYRSFDTLPPSHCIETQTVTPAALTSKNRFAVEKSDGRKSKAQLWQLLELLNGLWA
jgi:hypothetical protein